MRRVYGYNKRVAIILASCILLPCVLVLGMFAKIKTDEIYIKYDTELHDVLSIADENSRNHSVAISQKAWFVVQYPELNNVLLNSSNVKITPQVLQRNRAINNVIDALFAENDATEMNLYTTNKNASYLTCVDYVEKEVYEDIPENSTGVYKLEGDGVNKKLCFYKKYKVVPEYYNIIKISIPFDSIVDSFGGIKYESSYISIDNTFYSYTNGRYSMCELPNKSYYKVTGILESYGIEVGAYVDKNIIYKDLISTWTMFILILVVLVAVVFIVSNVISNSLLKGITAIVKGISLNDMDIIKNSNYRSIETDIIKDYLLELQGRLEKENNDKLKFESDLLLGRLSPHFLYNNLSAIKSKCPDKEAVSAIDRLVHYYRNVFQKGNQITTVKKEIENGAEYLQLMRFSYETDFRIEVEIEEGCEKVNIPANIVQPALENAFIHGINNVREKDGVIRIKAYKADDDLYISVYDNGGNFSQERYEARNADTNKKHALSMIAERMKLYYNDEKYTVYISGNEDYTETQFRFGIIE